MRNSLVSVVSAALLLGASAASAENMYVLVGVGQSKYEGLNKGGIDAQLTGLGLNLVNSSLKETDTAWKLQLGYQFNPYVAIEGGYYNLGKMKYDVLALQGAASFTGKSDGWNIDVVGTLPVAERFSVIGRLGGAYTTGKFNGGLAGVNFNGKESKWGVHYGAGLKYDFTRTVALRGEYERFNDVGDGQKAHVWSLALQFGF